MIDSPIFAGLEPHKWKVCVPRLGGFGTVTGTQADGLCAQREFFPLLLRSGLSGVKTPLGAQTGKSVFLG
jgi:hypothetical protein